MSHAQCALAAAGVARSREHGPHIMRHTFASLLLTGCVPVHAVSEYLGHADAGFTPNVYGHLVRSEPNLMRATIDAALESAPHVRAAAVKGAAGDPS